MDSVRSFSSTVAREWTLPRVYGQTPLSIANAVITVGSKDAYYQSSRVVRKSTSDLLLKLGATPLSESGVQIPRLVL